MEKVVDPSPFAREQQNASRACTELYRAVEQRPLPAIPAFAEWLAYRLAETPPQEVSNILSAIFPLPDQRDCDYLTLALQYIEQSRYCEREVGCGADFVFWGLEYPSQNMASARQWLAAVETGLR